jgi:hypothetical protein
MSKVARILAIEINTTLTAKNRPGQILSRFSEKLRTCDDTVWALKLTSDRSQIPFAQDLGPRGLFAHPR